MVPFWLRVPVWAIVTVTVSMASPSLSNVGAIVRRSEPPFFAMLALAAIVFATVSTGASGAPVTVMVAVVVRRRRAGVATDATLLGRGSP